MIFNWNGSWFYVLNEKVSFDKFPIEEESHNLYYSLDDKP